MGCTCRTPARCNICNTSVRVPLSYLEGSSGGALIVDRFARRDSSASRESLRKLSTGSCPCPNCGHTIYHNHQRACVAEALSAAGVPLSEREAILAKISFPEG